MNRYIIYAISIALAFLTGCTAHEELDSRDEAFDANSREMKGVKASIVGGPHLTTRGGTVTTLADYVGRDSFITNDRIVFTKICRTSTPLAKFTYPSGNYEGIVFSAGSEGGWSRVTTDGGPERIYWTDAANNHTFIGYSIPQDYYNTTNQVTFDWKKYVYIPTSGSSINYYIGSLGDPTLTGGDNDTIDYTLTTTEQETYKATANNTTVYSNPKLDNEDLLLAYDTEKVAETGGSVALIDFYHALSSVRVVVNISGFSSTTTSADTAAVVSNMRLLDQPTMYLWMQANAGAQAMRNLDLSGAQTMIDTAYGTSGTPAYNQKKSLRLWIPQPEGIGKNLGRTFTFYGITTPQDSTNNTINLKFDVTYPNPMKPSKRQTKTYTAQISKVGFEPGYNTTINISLNHKNEQMTIGAQYENWQFIATPDAGALKKNSTFLESTVRDSITIVGDAKATIDDATWLYSLDNVIYDIYGNDGSSEAKAYKICTAYQLLSFAYEVSIGNGGTGRDFSGKFIRMDADITMQTSAKKTKEEMEKLETSASELANYSHALDWIGIGDASHSFNGTFIGGDRYIYRLNGKPLFYNLGSSAKIKHLQMTVINIEGGTGAIAESNAGLICGSLISGDVTLNGTTAGAFVGENTSTGKIFCSYHIGDTESNNTGSVSLGGLVGTNNGVIASCYHAGRVTYSSTITPASGSTLTPGGITVTSTGTLDNNYYNKTLLPNLTDITGVTGKTSAEMTKQTFVDVINTGINTWRQNHPGYDDHQYQYNPANYPTLSTSN